MSAAIKYHGGKHYLAKPIVAMMPVHRHYVETHAGGLAVLLEKDPEGVSEVVNDIDGTVSNFWRVLQERHSFEDLVRRLAVTPFSEVEFGRASEILASPPVDRVLWAWAFFVEVRQSLAGRRAGFAPLSRRRTRRGMNEQASAWLSAIEGLPEVHERMKRVVVLCRDALDVIDSEDSADTLFYLDPPYLASTRAAPGVYRREASLAHHMNLLARLRSCKGKWMLSGYRSDLYDDWAERFGFARHDFDSPNHSAGGSEKRLMTECVWCNF